jgi:hypothetical protein
MPVIYYSPFRYRIFVILSILIAILMLVFGYVYDQWIFLVGGIFCLLFGILFSLAARSKLRPGTIALTREGDSLVGGELPQPLPIAETTFEINDDYSGSWVVCLYCGDQKIVLGAGGWKIKGARFFTRAVAERTLSELGIEKRP